jgi:16S rRNA (cytosine1407-C5)-methyltransferase
MSKGPAVDKVKMKKQQWIARTAEVLHVSEETTEHLLMTKRQQSVRINTLKATVDDALEQLKELGWSGEPIPWSKGCYTVLEGLQAIRDSELFATGQVYIQNAASWLPVLALDPQSGETVLDVCAAPGGKASHIAALANNQVELTVNDNSRPRLAKLKANLARLGVENVEYTLYDATQLARKLEGGQFDKILLDAPCSGEGMMRLDNDKDFANWSTAQIKRLSQLQKWLITQAWQLLKPGGTLVYSTCTMAPEENEVVIDYLLRHVDDARVDYQLPKAKLNNRVPAVLEWHDRTFNPQISGAMRLIPSPEVEAFFVCKLIKSEHQSTD